MDATTGGVRESYNLPKTNWRDRRSVHVKLVAAQRRKWERDEQGKARPSSAWTSCDEYVGNSIRYRGGWQDPHKVHNPQPTPPTANRQRPRLVRQGTVAVKWNGRLYQCSR